MDDYRDMDESILKKLREDLEQEKKRAQDLVDANNAQYGQIQELERQLAEAGNTIVELNAEIQRTADNLNAKLTEARAHPEARFERIKHQNNEMRVMMNRLFRSLYANPNWDAAKAEWKACNDWLSKNKIEPYEGKAPGVAYE